MKAPKLPTYGLHKPTGQARCYVNGKTVYLGLYGSEESRIRYGEIVAKVVSGQIIDPIARSKRGSTTCPESDDPGPSVGTLILVFLNHAKRHYVKNGKLTTEYGIIESTVRPLNELYGMIPAKDFGPLSLKAVREKFIKFGWVRSSVNAGVNRIRRVFKHAVANELIEPGVLTRLQCVAPLLEGRTEAPDNPPRTSVDDDSIEAIKKLVRPLVRDLIDVQRLTGSRSGELLMMTTGMLNRTGNVWSAELSDNKCRHHGKSRTLHFGPKAQLILARYLSADPDAKLFKMTRQAYCRAITRVCDKLEIARWVPHQLRHTAAEVVRDEFGLEHAQSVLGHSTANMTEHYAKIGNARAAEVARKIG
ncbi:MAG: tyrosine-type recombinase/integrase [Planctomycetaceae bacterium]